MSIVALLVIVAMLTFYLAFSMRGSWLRMLAVVLLPFVIASVVVVLLDLSP